MIRRRLISLAALARGDRGDAVAELAVAMPAVIIAMIILFNVAGFAAECAKFDRVAGEVARDAVLHKGDDLSGRLRTCMTYSGGTRHQVAVSTQNVTGIAGSDISVGVEYIKVTCTLRFSPWPSAGFVAFPGTPWQFSVPRQYWQHRQEFIFDRFKPGVLL